MELEWPSGMRRGKDRQNFESGPQKKLARSPTTEEKERKILDELTDAEPDNKADRNSSGCRFFREKCLRKVLLFSGPAWFTKTRGATRAEINNILGHPAKSMTK